MKRFAIQSQRTILDSKQPPQEATIVVEGERISDVLVGKQDVPNANAMGNIDIIDVTPSILMAGIVDTHAHINEPGRTEWEGFQTATRAAAAGGITTVIDMPLNSIPATTTRSALEIKASSAFDHCWIDYGFWGGVVPGNRSEIEPLIQAGVMGFKCFLIDSGVDEFQKVSRSEVEEVAPLLSQKQIPLLVHAELEGKAPPLTGPPSKYQTYLDSRPEDWEVRAIQAMIEISKKTKVPVHIVHLSAASAIPLIREAKASGVPITVETCPHYLSLEAEHIPDRQTMYKCAPPIRSKENQNQLWKALDEGYIDMVVSDHSPCVPALKKLETGDFQEAWGGIAGLQLSLPVVWTEMKKRGIEIQKVSNWMSESPSQLAGVESFKGKIEKGYDADFVIWDPEKEVKTDQMKIYHRHSVTPYFGRTLYGEVQKTYLRGQLAYDCQNPAFHSHRPFGKKLERIGSR